MAAPTLPRTRPGPSSRIGWLDAVKVWAIALVFLNHVAERIFGPPAFANPGPGWPPLGQRVAALEPLSGLGVWTLPANLIRAVGWLGDQGVSLFLVATGFVMVTVARRPIEDASLPRRWWYRLRSFLPMWWVCLFGWGLLGFSGLVPKADPFRAGFVLSVFGLRVRAEDLYYGDPAWWYIGLLVQLGLLSPFLVGRARRTHGTRVLAGIAGLCVVVRGAGLLLLHDNDYLDAWSRGAIVVTRLPEVLFGTVLCLWLRGRPSRWEVLSGRPVLVGAAAAWCVGLIASFTLLGNAVAPLLTGAGGFVLLAVAADRWARDPGRAVRWVGSHTLPLFLVHDFAVRAIVPRDAVFDSAVLLRIGLAAAVAVGLAAMLDVLSRRLLAGARSLRGRLGGRAIPAVLLVVAAAWGSAVAIDGWSRHLDPQELDGWGERPSLVRNAAFGWTLRPNSDTHLRWAGYDYRIRGNAEGFPGPLPPPARVPGVRRVLVTGDAFSSGEGLEPEQAWPRLLAERTGDEVLDFAVTGYGPDQEVRVLSRFVPVYRPDVVVVQVFVNDFSDVQISDQDFWNQIGFGRHAPDSVVSHLGAENLRALLRNKVLQPLRGRLTGPTVTDGYALGNFAALRADAIPADQSQRFADHLAGFARIARDNGAELRLMMIPASAQVCSAAELPYWPAGVDLGGAGWDVDQPQRIVRAATQRLGVPFEDLRPALAGPCLYRRDNMHLTAAGQQRVATVAADLPGVRR